MELTFEQIELDRDLPDVGVQMMPPGAISASSVTSRRMLAMLVALVKSKGRERDRDFRLFVL